MARITEAKLGWTLTSTGAGAAQRISDEASLISCFFTSSSGCTATVSLQTSPGNSSLGPWATLSPSTAMSTGAVLLQQFNGPLEWIRPYVTSIAASTDVVGVRVLAN
jgi:hypothetical protein